MRGLYPAAAALVTLAACGSPQPAVEEGLPGGCEVVGPVVVAAGGRSNMPAPGVQPISRYLRSAANAGAEVTVVEAVDRVMPVEDEEVSKAAQKGFEKRGIKL